jgi:hypothetical protein
MSNPIFKSGGKFYIEEVVNGKLMLREVNPSSIVNPTPPSSVAINIDNKISEAVEKILDKTDDQIIDDRIVKHVAPVVAELRQPLEICELHDAGSFEYEAEKFRWLGQSGIIGTRQYSYGGTKAYHRPFDIAYNPMNIHTHSNYLGLQGMAELVLSVNGYYIRTRHNDYRDWCPHSSSNAYEAIERAPRPIVPPSIVGTVPEQINLMRDLYSRLYNTLQENTGSKLTSAEKSFFRWDMAYAEIWWEVLTDDTVNDPGNATRHTNASNSVRQMLREAQFYNYGGHKNRFENTGFWVAAVKEVSVDGKPAFAVLKFRILTMPVATLTDYLPSQLFSHVKDYKTLMRRNLNNFDSLKNSAWGRFHIKEGRDTYGLLDQLVNKIPGLDNGMANLTEMYTHYGVTETIYNMSNSAVNNAGKYFRYSYILLDASGRDMERRGFNDPYLFVAMNTQDKCKKYSINGRDYRFSYMIPLEMVLRHPLEVWNPYQIPEAAEFNNVIGDGTDSNPFNAVCQDILWYLTPATFFGSRIDGDAADTTQNNRYYRGSDSVVHSTKASGTYIFLPEIKDDNGSTLVPNNGIRIRWPIYPSFHEGSYAFAELEAFKDYLITSNVMNNPS